MEQRSKRKCSSLLCDSWLRQLRHSKQSIFEYEDIKGEAHELKAKNINPYLVDAKDILIDKRTNPFAMFLK
jgi:hypothetical protein